MPAGQLPDPAFHPPLEDPHLREGESVEHPTMTPVKLHSLLRFGVAILGLAACQPGTPVSVRAEADSLCEASAPAIANLTYSTEIAETGSVGLESGRFRAPAAPGSATEVIVQLTEHVACGPLKGIPSAAVVLVSGAGGSGSFYSLHAVQPLDGSPAEVADTMLGDRVIVEQVSIDADRILVDLITHGPDEPLCCPTQTVTQSYLLEGTELRLVSTTPRGAP